MPAGLMAVRRVAPALAGCLAAAAMSLAAATPAHATISGQCTATALAGSSSVDVTTQAVWHVRSSDIIVGEGRATKWQTKVRVAVETFGMTLPFAPLIDRSGAGGDHGTGGPIRVADYSRYVRVFTIAGTTNDCTGELTIVIDDVSVIGSLAGALSLGLGLAGLLLMIAAAFIRSAFRGRVIGGVAGFFGGLGLAEFLQQASFLDSTSARDLLIPAAGALAGIILAGSFAPVRQPPGAASRPSP